MLPFILLSGYLLGCLIAFPVSVWYYRGRDLYPDVMATNVLGCTILWPLVLGGSCIAYLVGYAADRVSEVLWRLGIWVDSRDKK